MAKNGQKASGGRNVFKKIGHGLTTGFRWIGRHIYLSAFLFLIIALVFSLNASSMGNAMGEKLGAAVGWATGSFRGITEGRQAGEAQAKIDILKVEDTEVRMSTTLHQTQKLEVMEVSFNLADIITQGEDYAVLYNLPCDGIFSADLQRSTVALQEGKTMLITIPEPEFEVYPDDSEGEKIAEYQSHFWTGEADFASKVFLASRNSLIENAKSKMLGYDTLVEQAKEIALAQVTELARSVCGTNMTIDVRFAEEGGN